MKTAEELNALKEELEALNKKLAELTEDELAQVSGGSKEDQAYTCHICGKQFATEDKMLFHYKMSHYTVVP